MHWRLHVLSSPDRAWQGRMVPVGPKGLVLGRATEMVDAHDVDDPLLSRRHLEIRPGPRPEVLDARDLGSKNGTWRGQQRLTNATLGHDAVLRFGSSLAIVEGDITAAEGYDHPTPCIPGRSSRSRALRMEVDRAASGTAPVLVLGPTGAGKEFVVRELHARSGRAGPLVVVSAPTLSESAFEAEIFGLAPATRMGAAARAGLLAEAAGGTLVLDEVAELHPSLQAKLLRVLESGRYRPVGAAQEVETRVRIVATSNADLDTYAVQGRFRRDLLARFRTHVVIVPSLPQRRCDLLEYADTLVPLTSPDVQHWARAFTLDALETLLHHPWSENLRELSTVLHALQPLVGTQPIARTQLPERITHTTAQPGRAAQPSGTLALTPEAEVLRRLLRRHYGNIAKVAAHFGRDRRQIYRWMEQAGISEQEVAQARRGP